MNGRPHRMVGQINTGPFGWRKTGQPIKDSFIGPPTLVILIRTAPIPTILHFLTLYILCTLKKTSRILPDFSNTRRTSIKTEYHTSTFAMVQNPSFTQGSNTDTQAAASPQTDGEA